MSESVLVENLVARLSGDFDLCLEVLGTHPIDGVAVRIDLMARAKSHLVEAGFTEHWFGIECKWASDIVGMTSKMTRVVWQSITYAQSEFEVRSEKVRPCFVAVHTPDDMHPTIEEHLNRLLSLGLYGNVGRIYFYRDGAWGIKFASIYARAFHSGYHINQQQLPRRRVGSV